MAGDDLGRRHQDALVRAGAHQIDGDVQGGRRRRAAEPHVEGRAPGAQRLLHLDGDRRIGPLVMRGRADDQVDVGRLDSPACVERLPAPKRRRTPPPATARRRAAPECAAPCASGRECPRARSHGAFFTPEAWTMKSLSDFCSSGSPVAGAPRIFRIDPGVEAFDQFFIGDRGFGDFDADAADDDAMHVPVRVRAQRLCAHAVNMRGHLCNPAQFMPA